MGLVSPGVLGRRRRVAGRHGDCGSSDSFDPGAERDPGRSRGRAPDRVIDPMIVLCGA